MPHNLGVLYASRCTGWASDFGRYVGEKGGRLHVAPQQFLRDTFPDADYAADAIKKGRLRSTSGGTQYINASGGAKAIWIDGFGKKTFSFLFEYLQELGLDPKPEESPPVASQSMTQRQIMASMVDILEKQAAILNDLSGALFRIESRLNNDS